MDEEYNTSDSIEISLKEQESKGNVIAKDKGRRIGMMTYSKSSESLIIIDHTEVDPNCQGRDVGLRLLSSLVADARIKERKIIPLCPFANAMFRKHKQFGDVLK